MQPKLNLNGVQCVLAQFVATDGKVKEAMSSALSVANALDCAVVLTVNKVSLDICPGEQLEDISKSYWQKIPDEHGEKSLA